MQQQIKVPPVQAEEKGRKYQRKLVLPEMHMFMMLKLQAEEEEVMGSQI
jgi:hypothetical protein